MNTTPNPSVDTFIRGLWRENPVFVIQIGLCPTLAVTNTVLNAVTLGLATLMVLLLSSISISLVRAAIPKPVRMAAHVIIIGAWVTVVDFALQVINLEVYLALGIFVQLIVVNCIILGRADAFSAENRPALATLNALGMGLGFTAAMFGLGSIREVLGYGSFLGMDLFGPNFQPWHIMALPAGGFFVLGSSLLLFAWFKERPLRRKRKEEISHVG